jgi:hypothetical protein
LTTAHALPSPDRTKPWAALFDSLTLTKGQRRKLIPWLQLKYLNDNYFRQYVIFAKKIKAKDEKKMKNESLDSKKLVVRSTRKKPGLLESLIESKNVCVTPLVFMP